MERINIHFSSKMISQLKKLSKESGLSRAEMVRRIIDKFLEEDKIAQEQLQK